MNVDAVTAACAIMFEAKGNQQSFEVAEGNRATACNHAIKDFGRTRHRSACQLTRALHAFASTALGSNC
jgi:hypothetical protein